MTEAGSDLGRRTEQGGGRTETHARRWNPVGASVAAALAFRLIWNERINLQCSPRLRDKLVAIIRGRTSHTLWRFLCMLDGYAQEDS
jgi:hypothetical protein